jgi:hypothetical protein
VIVTQQIKELDKVRANRCALSIISAAHEVNQEFKGFVSACVENQDIRSH